MASPLLSELPYGSLLVYSPRGTTEPSVRSRRVRDRVKSGHGPTLELAMRRLAEVYASSGIDGILGHDRTLVPAPRSSLLVAGGLWPPLLIAQALVGAGYGREVSTCLVRTEPVTKSASARPGERPSALEHSQTMAVELELLKPERITLIDDFLTKGNTLLGGATRLREAFPAADITAFALVRTLGLQPEIERVMEPCVGTITAGLAEARREP